MVKIKGESLCFNYQILLLLSFASTSLFPICKNHNTLNRVHGHKSEIYFRAYNFQFLKHLKSCDKVMY